MRKIALLLMLHLFFGATLVKAQYQIENQSLIGTPKVGVKTNLLYDATSTFNLGLEFKLSDRYTLDISGNYNPWSFSGNKKLKHILVQPELRYWQCEAFYGHFFGAHLLYSRYNVGNLNLPFDILKGLKNSRYEGDAYGVGLSYGYHWVLASRWSLEASFGFGYVYSDYDRYECQTCGQKLESNHKHYFGPTKLGLSLIFLIN